MNIAEKKAEILRLIEQLHPDSSSSMPQKGKGRILKHPLSDRLERKRRELLELKSRREKTGLDLLEERMLRTCQMLEERIARIERIIGITSKQAAASAAHPAPSGTNFAQHSSIMEPAFHGEASAPFDPSTLGSESAVFPARVGPGKQATLPAPPAVKERVYTLGGQIQEGTLADILQLLSGNKKTGTFTADAGGKKVELYFRDGHLFHASCEGMDGQSAFFAAMALESGIFFFEETDQLPEVTSIDGNTQFMILEALRQIDEERAGK